MDDAFWDQPDNATQAAADCQQQWGVTPRRHWPGLQCALQRSQAFAAGFGLPVHLPVLGFISLPPVLLLLMLTIYSWPSVCRCGSALPTS